MFILRILIILLACLVGQFSSANEYDEALLHFIDRETLNEEELIGFLDRYLHEIGGPKRSNRIGKTSRFLEEISDLNSEPFIARLFYWSEGKNTQKQLFANNIIRVMYARGIHRNVIEPHWIRQVREKNATPADDSAALSDNLAINQVLKDFQPHLPQTVAGNAVFDGIMRINSGPNLAKAQELIEKALLNPHPRSKVDRDLAAAAARTLFERQELWDRLVPELFRKLEESNETRFVENALATLRHILQNKPKFYLGVLDLLADLDFSISIKSLFLRQSFLGKSFWPSLYQSDVLSFNSNLGSESEMTAFQERAAFVYAEALGNMRLLRTAENSLNKKQQDYVVLLLENSFAFTTFFYRGGSSFDILFNELKHWFKADVEAAIVKSIVSFYGISQKINPSISSKLKIGKKLKFMLDDFFEPELGLMLGRLDCSEAFSEEQAVTIWGALVRNPPI